MPSRWCWLPNAASRASWKNRLPPRWRTPTAFSKRRPGSGRWSRPCRSGGGFRPPSGSAKRSTPANSAHMRCWATYCEMWRDQAYYARDTWRGRWDTEGGGVLMNQAPHNIDFLLWFMGPAEEIFGYWSNLNHPYVEIEDNAVAVIRFRSGALGILKGTLSMNPERRIHGVALVG